MSNRCGPYYRDAHSPYEVINKWGGEESLSLVSRVQVPWNGVLLKFIPAQYTETLR